MYSILEYVKKNLVTFERKAFNEIDALVFSWLSYYRLPKAMYKDKSTIIKLKDLYNAKYFDDLLFDIFEPEKSRELLSFIASSERFRDIEMFNYVEKTSKKIEKQFSAMTFRYAKNKYFVAFRGTDHSFVGWKEDFNMSFMKYVPSQIEAKKYLDMVMSKNKGEYIVGGHSKGGNLAIYATRFVNPKYNKYIRMVYNFDGPNLNAKYVDIKNYNNKRPMIKKFVPQSSMVGMCFDQSTNYKIIRSNAIGLLQHNPFSWEIDKYNFKILKNSSFDSKVFKNGINALINTLDEKELRLFVNSIYSIIESTNTDTAENFMKDFNKNIKTIIDSISHLNKEQVELIKKIVRIYINEAFIPK